MRTYTEVMEEVTEDATASRAEASLTKATYALAENLALSCVGVC